MKSITKDVEVLWKDCKRHMGLPISFTQYAVIRKPGKWTKIVEESGFTTTHIEEVLMYRVDDLDVFQSLTDKMFNVGTITVYCKDASCDKLYLKNVKDPFKVKEIISDLIEEERKKKNILYSEIQH